MKILRKLALALGLCIVQAAGATPARADSREPVIAISQLVEHPDFDDVRRGMLDALAEAGFKKPTAKFVFESAQGDIATAIQIAKRYAGMNPDLILVIGTPAAQAIGRPRRTNIGLRSTNRCLDRATSCQTG